MTAGLGPTLSRVSGRVVEALGRSAYPVLHPSASLRSPRFQEEAERQFDGLRDVLEALRRTRPAIGGPARE